MKWETSHRRKDIDQVDLEGIDRDRRRILSGYGTSSKDYSKETEETEIKTDIGQVKDLLSEMPEDVDEYDLKYSLASIDEYVSAAERKYVLETTKGIREMTEEELIELTDIRFDAELEAVMSRIEK